jgi:transmembrane sensor
MKAGNPLPDLDAPAKAIQRRAAEWLALRQARPLTGAEQAALAEWCATDPRHAAMLAEVETAYRAFDRLAFYPRPPGRPIDPDLLVSRRWRVRAPARLAFAAAAAVAALFWLHPPAPPPVARAAVAATNPHFLRLPDGSRVELNLGSEVAVHFTASERRIRLVRGEAHFEVAKNPLRPFIVEADSISVRAVGTAFNVRLGATAVDVLVTEGKVGVITASDLAALAALGPGLILVAGQRTAVPTTPAPSGPTQLVVEALTQHQIDRALSWQTSRLVFEAMPLAEVVARFNRAADEPDGPAAVRLKISGASLEALRISGRVRYDSIENFVEVLEEDFGVTAERHGSEITLRKNQ